jgi:hypothetical protein
MAIAAMLVLSVGVVATAVTYSRGHGAAQVRHAVFQNQLQPAPALPGAAELPNRIVPNVAPPNAAPLNDVPDAAPAPAESQPPLEDAPGVIAHAYQIHLSSKGTVKGRIDTRGTVQEPFETASHKARGKVKDHTLRIVFLQRNSIVVETQAEPNGEFEVAVPPGVYGFVATGDHGYAAYAMQVLPYEAPAVEEETSENIHQASFQQDDASIPSDDPADDVIKIQTLAIPPGDFPTAKRLAQAYIPGDILSRGADSSLTMPGQELLDATPPARPPLQTSMWVHNVAIQSDCSLVGRMRRLHPVTGQTLKIQQLCVFLVRENTVVAQTGVSPEGAFRFPKAVPGAYTFVAAGADGFAAFSFEAVSQEAAPPGTVQQISFHMDDTSGGAATGSVTSENAGESEELIPTQAGAFFAGGAGGGGAGGGAGGGGGIGGLILGGLIGAGVGSLIDRDDDHSNTKSPANP